VPDCYHVVNPGKPDEIAQDILEAVRQVGGPGTVRKFKKRKSQDIVHAWTRYADAATARTYLPRITDWLERRQHEVSESAVVGPDHELDLEDVYDFAVEGYEPEPESGTAT
jgi:hypothetical protein